MASWAASDLLGAMTSVGRWACSMVQAMVALLPLAGDAQQGLEALPVGQALAEGLDGRGLIAGRCEVRHHLEAIVREPPGQGYRRAVTGTVGSGRTGDRADGTGRGRRSSLQADVDARGRRSAGPASSGPGLVVLFTVASFVGSTLLFLVQPLVAKLLTPLLGGTPDVWNTAMVFFQAELLAGLRRRPPRRPSPAAGGRSRSTCSSSRSPSLVLPLAVPAGWAAARRHRAGPLDAARAGRRRRPARSSPCPRPARRSSAGSR